MTDDAREVARLMPDVQTYLDRKYVARADDRQKAMGLAYIEADEPEPERIPVKEACLKTGLPKRTIQKLAADGQIPGAAKLGGRWTFDRMRLAGWIQEQEGVTCQRSERRKAATGGAASSGRASWSTVKNTDGAYARAMRGLLSAGAKNGVNA